MLMLFCVHANAQTAKELFAKSGIWGDYGTVIKHSDYPELKGRLVNIKWSEIETANNVWNWTIFDSDIALHTSENIPVIFMVYTGMAAPDWIFNNGVPKVDETNSAGKVASYSPYYLDADYNTYFKRMITKVRQHLSALPALSRNNIIAVQACFGSTGDQIAYKGNVAARYAITDDQFDSLFKVYSSYYYNEYKAITPVIKMLSNPDYTNAQQINWLNDNCPGGWLKTGTMNRGFQLNNESDKQNWLYDFMNKPYNGEYIMTRSEWVGPQKTAGWWLENPYKNLFAIMCYNIYWGLDYPNETADLFQDAKYDSALHFFNKYAGQKVPALATNAMCALKDVLDASDATRFSAATYGNVDKNNITRYVNIQKQYAAYGAKLEDQSSLNGNEFLCFSASGTNDVGWLLLPGNYDRYIHQIDANATSAGYWNVNNETPTAMYGRFARGFDLTKNKNALYFDVDNAFLRNAPLNAQYIVTLEITYYDYSKGSWQLFYDAKSAVNKASVNVTCGNTKTWKKKTITLTDAYFGNRSVRNSDFYIKSTGSANVLFSIVELSRPAQSAKGFLTTSLKSFDTVCVNSISPIQSFVVNAAYLNGSSVQIDPLNGYLFCKKADGNYTTSLNYTGYGTQINSTVYIKMNTAKEGIYNGNILLKGGNAATAYVSVNGTILNTSPALNASINQISCFKETDGAINLQPKNGVTPFTYAWTSTLKNGWKSTTQDVDDLKAADYTVTVSSYTGCITSKTFTISDPGKVPIPAGINGPSAVKKEQTGIMFSILNPLSGYNYVWTVPNGATITKGQNTSSITVKWGKGNGNVTAKSGNNCGLSLPVLKLVKVSVLSSDVNAEFLSAQNFTGSKATITNPAKDIATIFFNANHNAVFAIEMVDVSGRLLLTKKLITVQGVNTEVLNIQHFAAGAYFVLLMNDKGEKQTLKFIKQ